MSVEVHPQFVVDESGQRRSVLLSIEEFESLMAFVTEDDEDLVADADALDRALEYETEFRPWREIRDTIESRHDDDV